VEGTSREIPGGRDSSRHIQRMSTCRKFLLVKSTRGQTLAQGKEKRKHNLRKEQKKRRSSKELSGLYRFKSLKGSVLQQSKGWSKKKDLGGKAV